MCMSHIRQAKSLCTETVLSGRAALLFMMISVLHAKISVWGSWILLLRHEWRGKEWTQKPEAFEPSEAQVKTNPSYFLLILLFPQNKPCPAQSGGTGVPTGPTAPCCGNTSVWTSSQLQQSGFAAKRSLFSITSSGFSLWQCRSSAIFLGTSHRVLSDSKVEGRTAERCLSLMITEPPSAEDLQALYKPAVAYSG